MEKILDIDEINEKRRRDERLVILKERLEGLLMRTEPAELTRILSHHSFTLETLNKYTTPGNTIWPKPMTLAKFAVGFKVSSDYLLGLSLTPEAHTYEYICRLVMKMLDSGELCHAKFAIDEDFSMGSRDDVRYVSRMTYLGDARLQTAMTDYEALAEHIGKDNKDLLDEWTRRLIRRMRGNISGKPDLEKMKIHFSAVLNQYMAEHEVSQSELKEMINAEQSAVSKYVTGQSLPELWTLVTLHEKTGLSLDSMLFPEADSRFDSEFLVLVELLEHGCIRNTDFIVYDSPLCESESHKRSFVIEDPVLELFCNEYMQMLESANLLSETVESLNRCDVIDKWFTGKRKTYQYPLIAKEKRDDFKTLVRSFDIEDKAELYQRCLEMLFKEPKLAVTRIAEQRKQEEKELPFEI